VLAGGLLSRQGKPNGSRAHGTAQGVGEAPPRVGSRGTRQGKMARPSCATILGFLLSAFIWPKPFTSLLHGRTAALIRLKNNFLEY